MTPQELSEQLLHFAARVGKVVDALPAIRPWSRPKRTN